MRKERGPRGRVLFGARIRADLHKWAKHHAIEEGMSLRDLMEAALESYLSKAKKRGHRTPPVGGSWS